MPRQPIHGRHRWWRCGFLVLSFVVFSATSNAQVAVEAMAGVGQNVRPGAMAPISVKLENRTSEDMDGQVFARFLGSWAGNITTTKDLALPSGAVKRLWLYIPLPFGAEKLRVQYRDDKGRIRATFEERVMPAPPSVPVFAAVGQLPASLPPSSAGYRPEDASGQGSYGEELRYTPLLLRPEQLPDDAVGLEMFDVLFFAPPLERSLSSAQVNALREWVLRGGTLVIDASERTEAYRRGTFGEMMAFQPQTALQRELRLLDGEAIVGIGDVIDGEVLVQEDEMPLVIRKNYGAGSVVCFAVRMQTPALKDWEDRAALWRDVIGPSRLRLRQTNEYQLSGVGDLSGSFDDTAPFRVELANLVRQQPNTGLRLGLVLLLTVVYALVAGPGDYFLVRRLGKPILTWVTFPIIVAVFTVAAYAGAKTMVGGETTASGLRRTLVFPDRGEAVQFELASLFAAETEDYRLQLGPNTPMRQVDVSMLNAERVSIDADNWVWKHRIPVWTNRVFSSSRVLSNNVPDVDVEGVVDGTDLVLTVYNGMDRPLLQRGVYSGDLAWRLEPDEIAPGGSTELRLSKASARSYVAEEARIFEGFGSKRAEVLAFGRELTLRDALRRGAVIFDAVAGGAPSALVVNGRRRPEPVTEHIQVLTYEVRGS